MWVCPILHPAAVLRGRWGDAPVQSIYLRRVRDLADETWEPENVTRAPATHWDLNPSPQHLRNFFADPSIYFGLACDIETAGDRLICVGFARLADEECICLPFLKQGGTPYWCTSVQQQEAEGLLFRILADPMVPLCFQNGQGFDIPFLTRLGYRVNGYTFDTMLCQRYMYPEMPANLQFIANIYGRVPPWKWVLKEGENK